MSLVPYALDLMSLLALIDRVGVRLAVALALPFWTIAAAVAVGLWRCSTWSRWLEPGRLDTPCFSAGQRIKR
jgi:hypothetical protein